MTDNTARLITDILYSLNIIIYQSTCTINQTINDMHQLHHVQGTLGQLSHSTLSLFPSQSSPSPHFHLQFLASSAPFSSSSSPPHIYKLALSSTISLQSISLRMWMLSFLHPYFLAICNACKKGSITPHI